MLFSGDGPNILHNDVTFMPENTVVLISFTTQKKKKFGVDSLLLLKNDKKYFNFWPNLPAMVKNEA